MGLNYLNSHVWVETALRECTSNSDHLEDHHDGSVARGGYSGSGSIINLVCVLAGIHYPFAIYIFLGLQSVRASFKSLLQVPPSPASATPRLPRAVIADMTVLIAAAYVTVL